MMASTVPATSTTTSTWSYVPFAITSFPTVPLTTTFVPPSSCSNIYLSTVIMMDLTTSCLPPGFDTNRSSFFSPGVVCPSGYWTACFGTRDVSSITTVTCCPARGDLTFSCVDPTTRVGIFSSLFCTWVASKTTSLVMTESPDGRTQITTVTLHGSPEGINAFGVRMVYQSTDLSLFSSSASNAMATGTGPSSATTSTAPPSSPPPPSSSSSGGLSTGATAVIGVAVPVVVLALLGALGSAWWWRRKRRRDGDSRSRSRSTSHELNPDSRASVRQGLDSSVYKGPAPQQQQQQQQQERDHVAHGGGGSEQAPETPIQHSPAELAELGAPPVFELPHAA